jgi:hypothetical protein
MADLTDLTEDDEMRALERSVELQIEAMSSTPPLRQFGPRTERGTPFITFINDHGYFFGEPIERTLPGETDAPIAPAPQICAEDVIGAVSRYRQQFDGSAQLIWRDKPQITHSARGTEARVRLCFEPMESQA